MSGGDAAPQPGPEQPEQGPDQPAPSPPDAFEPRDPHGSLVPRGEDVAWSALGSLLAGPLVWGGVGYLVDRWWGTSPAFTIVGVVVGSLTAFYIVYLRFGRDD